MQTKFKLLVCTVFFTKLTEILLKEEVLLKEAALPEEEAALPEEEVLLEEERSHLVKATTPGEEFVGGAG